MSESNSLSLLGSRRFWPMFWTQFSGAFNDNFFKTALGFLVVYSGASVFGLGSEQFVPLTSAVIMIPYFLFSSTGGQLADKYEKGKLDKYKSACLCNIENPTNNLVSVLELCAMVSDITLH